MVGIQSSVFNTFTNLNSLTSTTGGSYVQGSIAMHNGLYYILAASASGNLEWSLINGPVAYAGVGSYPAGKVIYLRNRKTYITAEALDSNDPVLEGFQSPSNNQWIYVGSYSGQGSGSNPFDTPATPTPPTTPTTPSSGSIGSPGGNISLAQLKTLGVNISAFITQLQNSGTVNAIINQRINVLTVLLRQVLDYQTQVETGKMNAANIPIKFDDYKVFLRFVDINDPTTNMNNPLPFLLSATGASSALSNLFPFFFSGDISGAQMARELFEKYAKNLFTDVGYDVNVKLNKKSDTERKVAEEVAKALANGTLGKNSNLAFGDEGDEDGDTNGKAPSSVTGMFNSIIQAITGQSIGQHSTADSGSSSVKITTSSPPSAPGHFNWKDRSKEICDQINKRGLKAYDYGCLNNPEEVGENFSYRGYARMVCARLETNYDPSIPGLCGCPPPTWPGWRP